MRQGHLTNRTQQKGFSLLEILIAVSLFLTAMILYYNDIADMGAFKQRVETETRLKEVQSAFKNHYRTNAWNIDTVNANRYWLSSAGSAQDKGETAGQQWLDFAKISGIPQTYLQDGYNRAFRTLVTQRLNYPYEGVNIPYRVIAVITNVGGDIDPNTGLQVINSTLDDSNGRLNVAPGEMGFAFSTLPIAIEKFEQSKERLKKITNDYSQYYWGRYHSGIGDVSVDYFGSFSGNNYWDPNGLVQATCNMSAPYVNGAYAVGPTISSSNLDDALSIPHTQKIDGWGNEFYMLNCGSTSGVKRQGNSETVTARAPNGSDTNPPYTAVVSFMLANGDSYYITVPSKM